MAAPLRCPFCGYDLASLRVHATDAAPRPLCPECGRRYPRFPLILQLNWSPPIWLGVAVSLFIPSIAIGQMIKVTPWGIGHDLSEATSDESILAAAFIAVLWIAGVCFLALRKSKLPRWPAAVFPITFAISLANIVVAIITHVISALIG